MKQAAGWLLAVVLLGVLVLGAWQTTVSPVTGVVNPGVFTTLSSSANGAASTPAASITGTPFTGGSGTSTVPLFYMNQGAAPTTWSTSGTELGINAPSGFGGNFFDVHVNGGASVFKVDSAGNITGNFITGTNSIQTSAGGALNWQGSTKLLSPSDGLIALENNAGTSFTRLDFGGTTSSFPALGISGTTITAQLADGTAGGIFSASSYATVTNCASGASPAVCGAAASGSVAVPAGTNSTLQVNTTAVTANSVIVVQSDDTLSTKLSVTCNSTIATLATEPIITGRTGGSNFIITVTGTTTTNPACFNYLIFN